MGKKKIIISRSQLKKLSEGVDVAVPADKNTGSDYAYALGSSDALGDMQKMKSTAGQNVGAIVSGDKTKQLGDQAPTIDINVNRGERVQDKLQDPAINAAIQSGAAAHVYGDGFPNESTSYRKAQIEEARIANMKLEGKTYTKKTLLKSDV